MLLVDPGTISVYYHIITFTKYRLELKTGNISAELPKVMQICFHSKTLCRNDIPDDVDDTYA